MHTSMLFGPGLTRTCRGTYDTTMMNIVDDSKDLDEGFNSYLGVGEPCFGRHKPARLEYHGNALLMLLVFRMSIGGGDCFPLDFVCSTGALRNKQVHGYMTPRLETTICGSQRVAQYGNRACYTLRDKLNQRSLKKPSDHHRWGPVWLMPDPELLNRQIIHCGRPRRKWRDEVYTYDKDWPQTALHREEWKKGRETFAKNK
uniref:SFRICE_020624 n=1 Tax=Spodoptera frugiperda TaxID=7108 RepID=A0A2H1VX15_SPOFR